MTPRLRELEAEERISKDGRGYVDGVTVAIRRATIEGYKMALEDLKPVLDAAQTGFDAIDKWLTSPVSGSKADEAIRVAKVAREVLRDALAGLEE